MHDVAAEVVAILEDELRGSARNTQRVIGPSQLGTTCLRCLLHGLAETPQTTGRPSWYAGAGTALHWWAEHIVAAHELQRIAAGQAPRWHTEQRVTVGTITHPLRPGERLTIAGTCDLFDEQTGTVVDYKTAGPSTLKGYAAGDVKPAQVAQVMLYGLGMTLLGHDVREVVIVAIPRNAATLGAAASVALPFDAGLALATLDRADQWAQQLQAYGLDALLPVAGAHNGREFSCRTYPDADGVAELVERVALV